MSQTSLRIQQLGIDLPDRDRRGTGAVDAVLTGDMLYVSAHFPVDAEGKPVYVGRVGAEVSQEEAYQAARLCGINMLATIKEYIGDLDRVDQFIKVLGLVNSSGDFCSQPAVIHGFSDLMVQVFGKRGQHARAAMGAYALQDNMPVVVDAIIRVR